MNSDLIAEGRKYADLALTNDELEMLENTPVKARKRPRKRYTCVVGGPGCEKTFLAYPEDGRAMCDTCAANDVAELKTAGPEPLVTLPTLDEVLATLQPDAAYTGISCAVCGERSGVVTLMRVTGAGGRTGYICFGGDCKGQQLKAMVSVGNRMRRLYPTPVTRLTKPGHAMQWVSEDGKDAPVLTYARTGRDYRNRQARRKQQAASRRANRG